LIYRHFDGKYGLEPEGLPLPGRENNIDLYDRERKLFFSIGNGRFENKEVQTGPAENVNVVPEARDFE